MSPLQSTAARNLDENSDIQTFLIVDLIEGARNVSGKVHNEMRHIHNKFDARGAENCISLVFSRIVKVIFANNTRCSQQESLVGVHRHSFGVFLRFRYKIQPK